MLSYIFLLSLQLLLSLSPYITIVNIVVSMLFAMIVGSVVVTVILVAYCMITIDIIMNWYCYHY